MDSTTSTPTYTPANFVFSPEVEALKQLSSLPQEDLKESVTEGLRARFRYVLNISSPATSVVGEHDFPTDNVTGELLDWTATPVVDVDEVESEPILGQSF